MACDVLKSLIFSVYLSYLSPVYPVLCDEYMRLLFDNDEVRSYVLKIKNISTGLEKKPALILSEDKYFDRWPRVIPFNCNSPVSTHNQGLFAVMQLYLRGNTTTKECLDYFQQVSFSNESSVREDQQDWEPKYCGRMKAADIKIENPDTGGAPNVYIDDKGSIAVRIHLAQRKLLETETLILEIVFTPSQNPTYKYTMMEKGSDKPFSDSRGNPMDIAVLFGLYLLQGIPLGLCAAVPLILQDKNISYMEHVTFSITLWPFSLKLLWAPIVDSLYTSKFGRRKTWLITTQYASGALMLSMSYFIDDWLGGENWLGDAANKIDALIIFFFCLNFLAATQDIAINGWALTMLRRENVGYASTCNIVGQTAGYFFGYVVFIALESADFCNYWLRNTPSNEGLVKLSGFIAFWGLTFLVVTTLVAIFKKEDNYTYEEDETSIKETYVLLWKIISLPNVKLLAFILLTAKIAYSVSDGVTALKLIENDVLKDKFTLKSIPLVPLQIVLPLFIARYTTESSPMNVYIKCIPYRLLFNVLGLLLVHFTSIVLVVNEINEVHYEEYTDVPAYYFPLLILMYYIHQITQYSMFVSEIAFFTQISDPTVGGTYMTLLNTLGNLGDTWSSTVALWFVDSLKWKRCSKDPLNDCSSVALKWECQIGELGACVTVFDGYYLEVIVCTIVGIVWYVLMRPRILSLQAAQSSEWSVSTKKRRKS